MCLHVKRAVHDDTKIASLNTLDLHVYVSFKKQLIKDFRSDVLQSGHKSTMTLHAAHLQFEVVKACCLVCAMGSGSQAGPCVQGQQLFLFLFITSDCPPLL